MGADNLSKRGTECRERLPRAPAAAKLRSMRRGSFALFAVVTACSDLDLSRFRFACRSTSECAAGKMCLPDAGVCVPVEHDGGGGGKDGGTGSEDGGTSVDDGGLIGGRCFPSREETTPETNYWWCSSMRPFDLHQFVDDFGAKVIELELERGGADLRYAAALERKAEPAPTAWTE